MGLVGITEGAIPFAANDPIRVIPSIMVGAVVGNVIAFMAGVLNHAPWGGLIVLPVVEGRLMYVVAVLAGAAVTALMVNFLKKENHDIVLEDDADDETIELNFEEM